MPTLEAFGETDRGRKRSRNQDSYVCLSLDRSEQQRRLLAVADGMGGRAGGEVASEIAVESLRATFTDARKVKERAGRSVKELLRRAYTEANRAIHERACRDESLDGMGTTLVTAVIIDTDVRIANVGDSRAYRIGEDGIEQLTRDHSWEARAAESGDMPPEAMKDSPFAGAITRAMGTQPEIEADLYQHRLRPDDSLLLCSDGLYRELDDEEIRRIVVAAKTPREACETLVDRANEAGGADNITCVVARLSGKADEDETASDSGGTTQETLPDATLTDAISTETE